MVSFHKNYLKEITWSSYLCLHYSLSFGSSHLRGNLIFMLGFVSTQITKTHFGASDVFLEVFNKFLCLFLQPQRWHLAKRMRNYIYAVCNYCLRSQKEGSSWANAEEWSGWIMQRWCALKFSALWAHRTNSVENLEAHVKLFWFMPVTWFIPRWPKNIHGSRLPMRNNRPQLSELFLPLEINDAFSPGWFSFDS